MELVKMKGFICRGEVFSAQHDWGPFYEKGEIQTQRHNREEAIDWCSYKLRDAGDFQKPNRG